MKLCECGCGQEVAISRKTGKPNRCLLGHYPNRRPSPQETSASLEQRLQQGIHPADGCWIWKGAFTRRMAQISSNGRAILVRHFLYERMIGPLARGVNLKSRCGVARCVNPHHQSLPATRETFWNFVRKTDSCWIWEGGRTGLGYGMVTENGRHIYAHRLSYQMRHGSLDPELCILHSCDNPPCVNPDHLKQGTKAENNAEAWARVRPRKLKGASNGR